MAQNSKKVLGFGWLGCPKHKKNYQRCSIYCVVPPHMLENLVVHGSEQQREWAFQTLNLSSEFRGRRRVIGNVNFAVSPGVKRRTIFDAATTQQLPGKIVRGEGDPPSSDEAVNEAYDSAGSTFDFYYEVFERNSIDDKGLRLDSTVHYGVRYDNAFWNGDQMVYGDGDGELFQRFTKSIDVIAHELTHGVTQYEASLNYFGESGALNESMSDVFGALVKQWVNKQTSDQADWIIGEGLFTEKVNGVGIRSMKEPGTAYNDPILGKDPQPAHYKDLYSGTKDNGGVHINSGIPNKAFYLTAITIGGYAWEKAGKIWYVALRDRLRSGSNFKRAAVIFSQVAGELYGQGSDEQKAVQKAWEQVGVP
ncbi:MAG: peptidase M4 family protein [Calothrix sp. C42_A2020_038]|nr:peptidase M4 family protein [Calothrix sp. C42_A2020_038]